MPLNIIIKSGKSEDERMSQDNAKKILRHEYAEECSKGSRSHDSREHSKSAIKRAWEEDAKGNDDPHFKHYDEASKIADEINEKLIEKGE